MLGSSVIPCHASEHEHGEACSHHGNTDNSNDSNQNESDDHPCSPFCGFHSSVSGPVNNADLIIYNDFASVENKEKIFIYTPTYFYLQEFSIWNPPKQ